MFKSLFLSSDHIKDHSSDLKIINQENTLSKVNNENNKKEDLKELLAKQDLERLIEENSILYNKIFETQELLEASLSRISELNKQSQNAINATKALEKDKQAFINDKTKALGSISRIQNELEHVEKNKLVLEEKNQVLFQENNKLKKQLENIKNQEETFNSRVVQYQDENFVLICNMQQVQEELEQHYLDKKKIEQELNLIQVKLQKIEKNNPNLVLYDEIRLIAADAISTTPYIIWEARNLYHANISYPRFILATMFDGDGGGLAVLQPNDLMNDPKRAKLTLNKNSFYPHLLGSPEMLVKNYQLLGSIPWHRTMTGISFLNNIVEKEWSKIQFTNEIDPIFWKSFLSQLVKKSAMLPDVISFEKVVLKRELRHLDYEHLWLEVYNLRFSNQATISKLELRIGASLIDPQGFSRFPKFEFPLIDGKIKPFDSWYAESSDANGPKFELRFDLNKRAADFKALSKLSPLDLKFITYLMLTVPQFLTFLEEEQVAIARPWSAWRSLVDEANILNALVLAHLITPRETTDSALSKNSQQGTNDTNTLKKDPASDKQINVNGTSIVNLNPQLILKQDASKNINKIRALKSSPTTKKINPIKPIITRQPNPVITLDEKLMSKLLSAAIKESFALASQKKKSPAKKAPIKKVKN